MAGSIHHEQLPPKSVFLLSSCYSFNPERQFCILRWNAHWYPLADSRHWTSKRAHHCKLLRRTQVLSGPVLGFLWYLIPFWSVDEHGWSFIIRFIFCLGHRRLPLTAFIVYAFFLPCAPRNMPWSTGNTSGDALPMLAVISPSATEPLLQLLSVVSLLGKNAGSSNNSKTNMLYFTLVPKFNFVGSAKIKVRLSLGVCWSWRWRHGGLPCPASSSHGEKGINKTFLLNKI